MLFPFMSDYCKMADLEQEQSLLSDVIKLDEATLAQIDQIQKEIAESSEYIGDLESIECLSKEYAKDDLIYQAKITDLSKRYRELRRTRGDGNCFFRAVAFAYLETLLENNADLPRFKSSVEKCKSSLLSMGYPSFTLEDFHDTFIDVVDSVSKPETSVASLVETFRDEGLSNYVVCYLRIITSGYLQSNADFYTAFMEGASTVKEYCSTEVEPMYREADHLHISALTSALGICVRVVYMDRGESGEVNAHEFPEGGTPQIQLLYRPGHYDILYN